MMESGRIEADEVGAATGVRAPRAWPLTLGLLSGPLLWMGLFFLVPIGLVALYSVGAVNLFPTDTGVTLDDWGRFLTGDSVYLSLFWKSIWTSLAVSVVVVVLAYPLGYFLALCVPRRKYVLLLLLIAPFPTSFLLRVVAWRVILGGNGVVNSLLYWLGVRSPGEPVSWLLYSWFTVGLVLVYVWVPFVALPIFVTLENLDRSLLEAASDLGAGRWRAFWRVTFPLSLSGVGGRVRIRVHPHDRRVRHPGARRGDQGVPSMATPSPTCSPRGSTGAWGRSSRCS